MSKSNFVILTVAFICVGLVLADDNGACAGGYQNGDQINEGNYYYTCQNGQRVPQGCNYGGQQTPIGGTFTYQDSQMQCALGSDGYLTVQYTGCVQNGVSRDVGAEWNDGNSMYSCVKDGSTVRVVTAGCVDGGSSAQLGDQVAKGDAVYKCRKSNDGTATMNRAGCVYNGQNYNIGQTINGDSVWYTCTDKGPDVSGCYYNGQQLKNGDHFNKDDAAYACKVTEGSATLSAFGCLGGGVDRRIGCYWTEGDTEYTCKDLGDGKVAKVMTRQLKRK